MKKITEYKRREAIYTVMHNSIKIFGLKHDLKELLLIQTRFENQYIALEYQIRDTIREIKNKIRRYESVNVVLLEPLLEGKEFGEIRLDDDNIPYVEKASITKTPIRSFSSTDIKNSEIELTELVFSDNSKIKVKLYKNLVLDLKTGILTESIKNQISSTT